MWVSALDFQFVCSFYLQTFLSVEVRWTRFNPEISVTSKWPSTSVVNCDIHWYESVNVCCKYDPRFWRLSHVFRECLVGVIYFVVCACVIGLFVSKWWWISAAVHSVMLTCADRRGVMAVVVCDVEIANWNHYVACLLLAFLFLPLACARSSSGNVHIQYVCCLGRKLLCWVTSRSARSYC